MNEPLPPEALGLARLLRAHPGPDFAVDLADALAPAKGSGRKLLCVLSKHQLVVGTGRDNARFRLSSLGRVRLLAADVHEDRSAALEQIAAFYFDAAVRAVEAMQLRASVDHDESRPFPEASAGRAWWTQERACVAAVVRAAAEQGQQRLVLRLAQAVEPLWTAADDPGIEAADIAEHAVAAAQIVDDASTARAASLMLARALLAAGRHDEAITSITDAKLQDETSTAAAAAYVAGLAHLRAGRPHTALGHLQRGFDACSNDDPLRAEIRLRLGEAELAFGNAHGAEHHARMALAEFSAASTQQARRGAARAGHLIARAALIDWTCRAAEIASLLTDAEHGFHDEALPVEQAETWATLGDLAAATGRHTSAVTLYDNALMILQTLDHPEAASITTRRRQLLDDCERGSRFGNGAEQGHWRGAYD